MTADPMCGHCGGPLRGYATADGVPLCHPDEGLDCYVLVTVGGHLMPCAICMTRGGQGDFEAVGTYARDSITCAHCGRGVDGFTRTAGRFAPTSPVMPEAVVAAPCGHTLTSEQAQRIRDELSSRS